MNTTMAPRFRLLICVFALSGTITSANPLPVQSVPHVDLKRYSGKSQGFDLTQLKYTRHGLTSATP